MNWLILAWIPASFFLHCLVHEMSHAVACWTQGVRVESIWLLPGWRIGRFTFAHIRFSPVKERWPLAWILVAPLIVDAVWFIVATVGVVVLLYVGPTWAAWIAAIEAVAALIDAGSWVAGAVFSRKGSDGDRFVELDL